MNNEKEEIQRLERELKERKAKLQQQEKNCYHEWNNAIYDPEEYQEPVFSHYERQRVHLNPNYDYYTKKKDRWSRICKKCGKKEYTYVQKPVKYEPNFK